MLDLFGASVVTASSDTMYESVCFVLIHTRFCYPGLFSSTSVRMTDKVSSFCLRLLRDLPATVLEILHSEFLHVAVVVLHLL
ncbi:hypothetical protein O3M35_002139 [Rhynocoris fuscipes]|uniref:Uncharacterized protein n=1 Tax=Rhynocoris fuscipes TaxID=488301 RepID=A0AAW1CQ19_9HEMI